MGVKEPKNRRQKNAFLGNRNVGIIRRVKEKIMAA